MDPIVIHDEIVNDMRDFVRNVVAQTDETFTMHDFRMTYGKDRKNLIFDLSVPIESKWVLADAERAVAAKFTNFAPIATPSSAPSILWYKK